MAHPYWFGIAVKFDCKACGKTSVEKYGANAPTDDIEKLKQGINKQPLYCRHCWTPTADGTVVDVAIVADTRESLFRQGYEVPEMPGDR